MVTYSKPYHSFNTQTYKSQNHYSKISNMITNHSLVILREKSILAVHAHTNN